MNMKRIMSLLLIVVLSTMLLVGCGGSDTRVELEEKLATMTAMTEYSFEGTMVGMEIGLAMKNDNVKLANGYTTTIIRKDLNKEYTLTDKYAMEEELTEESLELTGTITGVVSEIETILATDGDAAKYAKEEVEVNGFKTVRYDVIDKTTNMAVVECYFEVETGMLVKCTMVGMDMLVVNEYSLTVDDSAFEIPSNLEIL